MTEESNRKPEWLSKLVQPANTADVLERVTLHMLDPAYRPSVLDKGEVSIPIPKSWHPDRSTTREKNPIPSAIVHTKSLPIKDRDKGLFAKQFRKEDAEQAFTFWLSSDMLGGDYPLHGELGPAARAMIESQVSLACDALQAKHEFSELDFRVYYPPADLREALGHKPCAAVVMAALPHEAGKFTEVYKQLLQSRTKAQVIENARLENAAQRKPEPFESQPQKMLPRDYWSHKYQVEDLPHRTKADLALADICRFRLRKPEIVDVTHDRIVLHHPSLPEEADTLVLDKDLVNHAFPPSKALVLWLAPEMRTPSQETIARTLPVQKDPLPRELDRLVVALQKEIHTDLTMVPRMDPNTGEPVALIFCADTPDQQHALRKLRGTIEHYAELHAKEDLADRRGPSAGRG